MIAKLFRRRKAQPPAQAVEILPDYQAEIIRLERRLADLIAETEQLARVRLLEWKVRKAEERKAWLEHGVRFPQSPHDAEQDQFFRLLEARMRQEQEDTLRRIDEREKEELRRISREQERLTWDREEAERKALTVQTEARQHQLAQQRIEAQKQIAQTIAKALNDDLGG